MTSNDICVFLHLLTKMAHNIYLLKERVFFIVRGLMQCVNDREKKGHQIMGYLNELNNNTFDLSKVRDRRSKKWVAMMLPEHVQLIRQYNEDTKKIPRPNLMSLTYWLFKNKLK